MSQDVARQVVRNRRPVRLFALLVGIVFITAGIAGFIPGLTTGYGDLAFVGPESQARLFGVFAVSILHNLVHLLFGVLGIAAFRHGMFARGYLLLGGGFYLLLSVYGVGIAENSAANFLPLNNADDWLHLGLGAGMIALGVLGTAIERLRGTYPAPPGVSDAVG
ncbi:DUF4383 domain-containing protein [Saccharomonospora sp.]|uniref:DUF4383 domain-containing protein n=1 Tax=Saccharomonospora sp. TaxID=33913 RepID=UPI0026165743|nr:DUF4383 domain-containing protein [Saccharomonospora sp.]